MYDINGNPIGPLAPASTPAIDHYNQISQNMVHAIVAVEDRGFWSESGISVRGLLRAALADLTGGKTQGASTIPEEFIKNVRQEEGDRTVAEKVVEAGMAFQLSHHWKHVQILTAYLNSIYFGNGALGNRGSRPRVFRLGTRIRPGESSQRWQGRLRQRRPAAPQPSGVRERSDGARGGAAGGHGGQPKRLQPSWQLQASARRRRPVATWCSMTCTSSTTSPRRTTRSGRTRRCRPPTRSSSRSSSRRPLRTSRAGSNRRSCGRSNTRAFRPSRPSTRLTTAGSRSS